MQFNAKFVVLPIRPLGRNVFAEAARYTAIFYDSLAITGALLVAVSGFLLVLELGLGFFDEPWLVGMWGLFLFEFVEGTSAHR